MDLTISQIGITSVEITPELVPNSPDKDQQQSVISTRMNHVTNITIDRDALETWNERRIIRTRMQNFASTRQPIPHNHTYQHDKENFLGQQGS